MLSDLETALSALDVARGRGWDVRSIRVGAVQIEVQGWHAPLAADDDETPAAAPSTEDPMAGLIPRSVRESIERERRKIERLEDGEVP